jgi:hypothetical protein
MLRNDVQGPAGKMHTKFLSEYLKESVKADLKQAGCEGMDWIHLAEDRDHWWAVVNTVIKL